MPVVDSSHWKLTPVPELKPVTARFDEPLPQNAYTSALAVPPGAPVHGVDVTLNAALVPAVRQSPPVRVAVMVAPVPAVASVTPVTVYTLVPASIEPVVVPPIAPAAPLVVRLKAVLVTTLLAVLVLSWDSTTTSKPAPAVGVAGEMAVTTSLDGAVAALVPYTIRSLPVRLLFTYHVPADPVPPQFTILKVMVTQLFTL